MAKQETTVADSTATPETATPAVVPATENVAQPVAQPFVKPAPQVPVTHAATFAGDPAAHNATPAVTEETGKVEGKVYTQAQIDAMIQQRLDRALAKYVDYDDLKAQVTTFNNAKLSADEQAAQRLKDLETQATTLAQEKAKLLVEVSFKDAASELGLPSDAAYKLADMAQAKYDEAGRITNAKDLAAAVAAQYPGLVKRTAAGIVNPGRDGNQQQETDDQKRHRLLRGGGGGTFWQSGGVTMPASLGDTPGD